MNKNIFKTISLAAAFVLGCYSCSDTWDEHYEATASGLSFDGTIMSYLQSNSKFSDFAEVVKATGYDKDLSSGQVFTLWAPENGSFDKQTYLDMIANGNKDQVLKEFVKNHVARYNVSYTPNSDDKDVTMLNSKIITMTGEGTFGTASIENANVSCKNGVVHVINKSQDYQNNLFEQIEKAHQKWCDAHPDQVTDSLVSLYTFLKKYNSDSLDVNKSVYRDMDEDGNKIYVDSVLIRNNTILNSLDALLYTEDSTYWAFIPSVEAYQTRYEEAKKYLVYNPSENLVDPIMCDSLQSRYANEFVITDLFFNGNPQVNAHPEDSVVSTIYSAKNWEKNVYYQPFAEGGLFTNYADKVECSNGIAYMIDEYPQSIYDQYFLRRWINCYSTSNIDTSTDSKGNERFTKYLPDNLSSLDVSRKTVIDKNGERVEVAYIDIEAKNTSSNPIVAYKIPNTLSATYDIYMVYSPYWVKNYTSYAAAKEVSDTLRARVERGESTDLLKSDPLRTYIFQANVFERQNTAKNLGEYPTNGTPIPAKNQSIETSAENVIDTLYLGTYTCANAYYATTAEGILLQIKSMPKAKELVSYTRGMLLNKIIFTPHIESEEPSTKQR